MEPKNNLKRNLKSAKIQVHQVPSKLRKTTVNLNNLTKIQLIDKIAILNKELESMKIQLKTVEPPLVDTKSVTQISALLKLY